MNWTLNKSKPVTPQICEILSVMISVGELTPGTKLPSVREVAIDAGVNPNTVQKSFEELERNGLIRSVRSIGWFVNDDISSARETVKRLIEIKTTEYLQSMKSLGLSGNQVIDVIKEAINE